MHGIKSSLIGGDFLLFCYRKNWPLTRSEMSQMRISLISCFASLILALSAGCSLISDFSDYVFPEEDETPVPTEREPTGVVQTVGGGTCTSVDYKLTVSIGMPQPMGSATSGDYTIKVGPESVIK
jgi:hypothetical protein